MRPTTRLSGTRGPSVRSAVRWVPQCDQKRDGEVENQQRDQQPAHDHRDALQVAVDVGVFLSVVREWPIRAGVARVAART